MADHPRDSVLVTGGSGLVGRAIAEELNRDDHMRSKYNWIFVSSRDADLTNLSETQSLFQRCKPKYVINLAARVGGLYANIRNNQTFCDINTAINENLLRCAYEAKVLRCISFLSTCIFPAEVEYPLDETKIHLGPPHESNKGYASAKRQVDSLNRHYNSIKHVRDMVFSAIIPTNIFGKHDNFNLDESHVIPGLVHKGYKSILDAKNVGISSAILRVCGSGEPLRQFIYAPDLAKLTLWTLENYRDETPLIICPDENEEVSIGEVAHLVSKIYSQKYKFDLKIEFNARESDGQYRRTTSNAKLRSLCPEFKFTPLELGLEETIDWFSENYPNVRK